MSARCYLVTVVVIASLISYDFPAAAGTITIKGSDTLVILSQKWAQHYMSMNPQTKIQVTGGGSGVGLAALQNNNTDIANASRSIRPAERAACIKAFGRNPREYKVALDSLLVYVHPSNPIDELSLEQLRAIYTGRIRNWEQLGGLDSPISLYSRENSSGTYEFFKAHVLKGRDFIATAQTMPGTAAVIQAVAKEPNGIGYGGAAYGHGAKHLRIKKTPTSPAIEPSEENILSGQYPIWRFLFNYLNPAKDKGEIGDFLHWVRSDEGQAVVKEVGYYPLPPDHRVAQDDRKRPD